jgi:ABC-type transport system involved in Fe-S cluster assembly fused permease/ATPase subunit
LGAYFLVSGGRVTGASSIYQWMNVVGAVGFVLYGWWHGAVATAALNVIWFLIGAVSLWRIWSGRRASASANRAAGRSRS